jgi:ribonuclease HI
MSVETIIYTDGACLGNPGPGGWAAIVGRTNFSIQELGGVEKNTTNNRMELLAVIQALEFLLEAFDDYGSSIVIVHSDSSYVVQGASKWIHGWKKRDWKNSETGDEVKNKDLWMRFDEINFKLSKKIKIDWRHIEGHRGIPGNERCDFISNSLARGEFVELYKGPFSEYQFTYGAVPSRLPSSPKDKSKMYYLSLINGQIFRDQTWAQCEARVKSQRGVKYKKCHSPEEEAEILKTWGFVSSKSR